MREVQGRRTWIALTETSYVEALWMVRLPDGDWLACVYRDEDAAPWRVVYRFRWYVDAQAWGSKDRRTGATALGRDGSDATRATLVATVDEMAETMAACASTTVEKILVRGGIDAWEAATRDLPWMHRRTEDRTS